MFYFKMIGCFFISISILTGCSSISRKMSNIDELIKPYQIALDELNEEIGSALCIPEDAKSNVYEAYKNYSISEFKEMIRREYQNSSSDESIYKEGVQFTEDIIIK